MLVWQEAGGVAAAVALTGASKRPDAGTTAFLRAAPSILWSLDFDEAGAKAWPWWKEHFPTAKPWPCAAGKDPGDMLKVGIPICAWVQAGIAEASSLPGVPEPAQNAASEAVRSTDELKAIPPIDEPENRKVEAVLRLAELDTNIAALVGWGLLPHLEGGALVIDGLDALDTESRDGVGRWLDHRNRQNEPRSERVARALRTGRCCTC